MILITKLLKIVLLIIGLCVILIVAFYGHKDIPLSDLKLKYAPPPSSFITVDGMDVHYRDEGSIADSVPVVLIHGTSSSLQTFDDWAAILKSKKRVIRMDIPAFGLTGPFPDRNYSIDNYVLFIEHFLSAIGVNSCILGGNSLGGEIAWQVAFKNPRLVDKLVLINAAGYPVGGDKSEPIAFTIARLPILNKILTYITPRSIVREGMENVYVDKSKIIEVLVDRYFELTLREGNRQALVDRMTLKTDTGKIHLIKNIQQSTLVLWGEHDLLIPTDNAHRFNNDLPNDSLIILKDVGHVPMKESPAAVLAFLKI